MSSADGLGAVEVYSIPLRSKFRGLTHREGLLLQGVGGWGEFSPFLEYSTTYSQAWLRCAQEAAQGLWPAPLRDEIPINATVPAVDAAQVEHVLARFPGCRTAKVKVAEPGQDLNQDLDRVAAVRAVLGSSGRIRIDANGGWNLEQARQALPRLDRAAGGLEYAEQPVADVVDLARLRAKVGVPIAADESIRRAEDPYLVKKLGAADIAVLKVQPLGGVQQSLQIAADIGLPVVVSSALETSLGIAAGVALAAALPELPFACGLGTVSLLADDVAAVPLRPQQGYLSVAASAQVRVDPAALARCRAAPDRTQAWRRRLDEVERLIG